MDFTTFLSGWLLWQSLAESSTGKKNITQYFIFIPNNNNNNDNCHHHHHPSCQSLCAEWQINASGIKIITVLFEGLHLCLCLTFTVCSCECSEQQAILRCCHTAPAPRAVTGLHSCGQGKDWALKYFCCILLRIMSWGKNNSHEKNSSQCWNPLVDLK